MAIYSNRVLVLRFRNNRWVHALGCRTKTPECFFMPISNCSLLQVQALVQSGSAKYREQKQDEREVKGVDQGDVRVLETKRYKPHLISFRHRLHNLVPQVLKNLRLPENVMYNNIFNSTSAYTIRRAWHTQASLYLLRLNRHMQQLAREALEGCSLGDDYHAVQRKGAAEQLVQGTIGVPLRGSDKCRLAKDGRRQSHGEMRCTTVHETVDSVTRVLTAQPWLTGALVSSEDALLAANVKRALGRMHLDIRENKNDVQQGSGAPVQGKNGSKVIPNYLVTQSMLATLTCQVMPMYHVITMRSNYHSLIDMLAKVVPGKTAHLAYNIGDVYMPA